jgi:hypothetical protein
MPTFNLIQAKCIASLAGKRDFSPLCKVQAGSMAHPSLLVSGTRGSLPAGMKLPMHDADHLPPSCAKV